MEIIIYIYYFQVSETLIGYHANFRRAATVAAFCVITGVILQRKNLREFVKQNTIATKH